MDEPICNKIQRQGLIGQIRSCVACPLRNEAIYPVPTWGNLLSPFLFAGQNPGSNEDKDGIPFIGRAGEILDSWLELFGLLRIEIIITNIVKCHTLRNRTPSAEECYFCRDKWFIKEIQMLKPKVLVLLGNPAIRAIFGPQMQSATKIHGLVYERILWGHQLKIIPLWHPGYFIYAQDKKEMLQKQLHTDAKNLKKLFASIKGEVK